MNDNIQIVDSAPGKASGNFLNANCFFHNVIFEGVYRQGSGRDVSKARPR